MIDKRLVCEYRGCSKSYCSPFNLKRHIEIVHQGIKKFRCSICGRFLSSKQNLVDHNNIHTGAKPYICEVGGCGMCFRQLSQYYIHQQLHIENAKAAKQCFLNSKIIDLLCSRLSRKGEEDPAQKIIQETPLALPIIYKNEGHEEIVKLPGLSSVWLDMNMNNHKSL